jgi:predicted HTH domain antitoxin
MSKLVEGIPQNKETMLDLAISLYEKLNLPLETFANQVGVEPQTVRLWLRRKGNVPSRHAARRILSLYERNLPE